MDITLTNTPGAPPPAPPAEAPQHAHETRRGRDLLDLSLYSIAEGRLLGRIDGLFLRREDFSVALVRVKPEGGGNHVHLAYGDLRTVGEDVALVESADVLRLRDQPADARAGLESDLPGRSLLTRAGENVGTVAGFGVDTANGRLTDLRATPSNRGVLGRLASVGRDTSVGIPVAQVISLGPDAVIVDDAVKRLLHPEAAPEAAPPVPDDRSVEPRL